jgi:tripartite-type tricarboxylate transporter receptor subunit TctC
MTLIRRDFLQRAGATIAASVFPQVALALDYPIRPVRLIVPSAAGGPVDVIARLIAQKLSERWGQPIHIENIPAGAGNVGIAAAAKAAPDGYTILATTSSYVVNPSLYARIPYDPVTDFAPISLVAAAGHVLVVHPSVPAKDVKELIALVRSNPGKYSYASPGAGTTGQMVGELFKLALGLDLIHVPFNGAAPAVTATMGGHTPIAFLALPGAAANIKDGTLRISATASTNAPVELRYNMNVLPVLSGLVRSRTITAHTLHSRGTESEKRSQPKQCSSLNDLSKRRLSIHLSQWLQFQRVELRPMRCRADELYSRARRGVMHRRSGMSGSAAAFAGSRHHGLVKRH